MSKIGITIDVDWAPDFMIDYRRTIENIRRIR
jgi:hypothetical protein